MIRRAIRQARKVEVAYHDALRDLGCAVCYFRIANGMLSASEPTPGAIDLHHRNVGDMHGQKQLGQDCVVPLCSYHHDDKFCFFGWSPDEMREVYGPSFGFHAKDFREWTADVLPQYPGRGTERWQHYADDLLRESGFGELVDVVRGQREAE